MALGNAGANDRFKDNSIRYEMPSRPFDVFFERDVGEPYLPRSEMAKLIDVCSWKVPPPFEESGRSAFLRGESPLFLPDGSKVEAYQIKGLGCFSDGVVRPPAPDRSYIPDLQRVDTKVDSEGNLYPLLSQSSILGGTTQSEARREFDNLIRLKAAGISVPSAIRWGSLDLEGGESLGLVVLGHPSADSARFSTYFKIYEEGKSWMDNPYLKDALAQLYGVTDQMGTDQRFRSALLFIARAQYPRGVMLRSVVSEAGLFDIQPHLGNFTCDHRTGVTMLHDFETLRGLEEVGEKARGIYILLDLAKTMATFSEFLIDIFLEMFIDKDGVDYLLDIANFNDLEVNPFLSLLSGYFSREISGDPGFEAEVKVVASKLWSYSINGARKFLCSIDFDNYHDARFSYLSGIYHSSSLDLMELYNKSELGRGYPLVHGRDELSARLIDLERRRDELFQRVQVPKIRAAQRQEFMDFLGGIVY